MTAMLRSLAVALLSLVLVGVPQAGCVGCADGRILRPGPDSNCIAQPAPEITDHDGDGWDEWDDCDDHDPARFPGNPEVACDGIDQDCDGEDADLGEEIPYDGIDQDCSGADTTDVDADGHHGAPVGGDDCDDEDPTVHPGATEVPYDGIDQDCDGEDLVDVDGDGYASVEAGGDDCNDDRDDIHPGVLDDCWGGDEDCDGQLDEDADVDDDGYSWCEGDCNDNNASIHPGAEDIPLDGINQDCSEGDQGNCGSLLGFFFSGVLMYVDLEFTGCASWQDGALWAAVEPYSVPSNAICDTELNRIEWTDSVTIEGSSGTSSFGGTFWGYYDLSQEPMIEGGDNSGEFEGSGYHVYEGSCTEVTGFVTVYQ